MRRVALILALAILSGVAAFSAPQTLFTSREPVVALCPSPDGGDMAFVTAFKGENRLVVRSGDTVRAIDQRSSVNSVHFLDANRLLYSAKGSGIILHDLRAQTGETLCQGVRPVPSPQRNRIAYQREESLRLLDLARRGDLAIPLNGVFIPCDWLDDHTLLACRDGSVWRITAEGPSATPLGPQPNRNRHRSQV